MAQNNYTNSNSNSSDNDETTQKIIVHIETNQINGETKVAGAVIKLCTQHSWRHWTWRVNLQLFPLFQAMLSFVTIISDCVFEAVYINKQNLPNIDGQLIINILDDLLKILIEEEKNAFILPPTFPVQTYTYALTANMQNNAVFPQGSNSPISLPLDMIKDDFVGIKDYLEDRQLNAAFHEQVSELCDSCNAVRTMCNIYFNFVYLIWQRTNLNGHFDQGDNELARL